MKNLCKIFLKAATFGAVSFYASSLFAEELSGVTCELSNNSTNGIDQRHSTYNLTKRNDGSYRLAVSVVHRNEMGLPDGQYFVEEYQLENFVLAETLFCDFYDNASPVVVCGEPKIDTYRNFFEIRLHKSIEVTVGNGKVQEQELAMQFNTEGQWINGSGGFPNIPAMWTVTDHHDVELIGTQKESGFPTYVSEKLPVSTCTVK